MTDRIAADAVASSRSLAGFELARPLPPAALYRRCDPAELPFALCSELEDAPGQIGQERAVEAIGFAMRMRRKGYNIYALGATGTGRHALVEELLRDRAAGEPAPPDWCYVNNFADPQQPRRLSLPPGRGAGLAAAMKRLVEELRAALPAAFERDEYRARREVIDQQLKQRNEDAFGAVQQHAQQQSIALLRTPMGLALAPMRDGKVLPPEAFEAAPAEERDRFQHDIEAVQKELEAAMHDVPLWERAHRDALRELNRETTGLAIGHLMRESNAAFSDLPEVAAYLDAVEADVKENVDDFLAPATPPADAPMPAAVTAAVDDARFRRYGVNLFVDNAGQRGAPVVYEDNPTHQTLVGRVEHLARFGALVTDFNLLKPGALHRANGGYLILDAQKLVTGNFGWASLKRALDAGQIRIETIEQLLSMASTLSLTPDPIPLAVKVVLVGSPALYSLLSAQDEEFAELFKIAADFEDR
ncbi:MAG: AAA family ATPase, partial [Stellaceae bacterium]